MLCGSAFFLWKTTRANPNAFPLEGRISKRKIEDLGDLIDDINFLGEVRFKTIEGRKLLDKKYFVDLVSLITFHVRNEFREERAALLKQRREIYNKGDDSAYEDVVREIYLR